MSIEIKAYRCEYHVNGCAKKLMLHRKNMERHEAVCIANPANRTCKTCRFDSYDKSEFDDYGMCYYPGRNYCANENHERIGTFERNCPDWEPKL